MDAGRSILLSLGKKIKKKKAKTEAHVRTDLRLNPLRGVQGGEHFYQFILFMEHSVLGF